MQHLKDAYRIIEELNKEATVGEQWESCKKFMSTKIDGILPQVVCIMLSGPKVSFPIYALLRERASRSLAFRTRLFFTLKSSLATADESSAAYCYFLCCDLIDLSIAEQKRNVEILYRNYRMRHPRRFKTVIYNKSRFILPRRSAYSEKPEIRKKHHRVWRTHGCAIPRIKMPSFEGLWVFFARAISSLTAPPLFHEFDRFMRIFSSKKNFKNLNMEGFPKSSFRQGITFYNSLVGISTRLKGLPIHLRQRALEVELKLLNVKPFSKVLDPFSPDHIIVNILVEECDILDSADNVPYMFFAEVIDRRGAVRKEAGTECCRAGVLWSHLNSLSELGDVGDVNGIRENILEALEQVLFVGEGTPSEKSENDAIEDKINEIEHQITEVLEIKGCDKRVEVDTIGDVDGTRGVLNGSIGDNVRLKEEAVTESGDSKDKGEQSVNDDNLAHQGEMVQQCEMVQEDETTQRYKTIQQDEAVKHENSNQQDKPPQEEYPMNSLEDNNDITNMESISIEQDNNLKNVNSYDEKLLLLPKLRKWDNLKARVMATSPLRTLPGWDITSFIIKSGSSLKLEYLAYQIISEVKSIFIEEGLPLFLKDYQIYLISETSGFVETVRDTLSVHKIKGEYKCLLEYFKASFEDMNAARRNFLVSLVGYSLVSFLLQLKDRHNGNILIDGCGHILHVDFAFILGKHPGFYCVENAPFKFADDYMELIDLEEFRQLFYSGFVAISQKIDRISLIVEIIEKQGLCDSGTTALLVSRMNGGDTAESISEYCKSLVDRSVRNMRTMVYDRFQYFSNGYF